LALRQGVADAPRTDRPTPAQAQAIWDSLEQPSLHKVADAFKAQGRPVSPATIWNWQQAGWSDVTAQNAVTKANRAVEKIAAALPALTGDATSTLSDFLSGNDVVPDERHNDAHNDDQRRNDTRSKAEIAEETLLEAMQTARAVNAAIHKVAAAVARADVAVSADAPLPMLLRQPDGIAKLMMASNAGISVTIAGIRQLPAMRAEEAAEIPGTQTVYRGQNERERILALTSDPSRPSIIYLEMDLSAAQLAGLYTACYCLVQPYRGEGFCLPALEALSCGVPVLVPKGGPTDDFVDEEVGWPVMAEKKPFGNRKIGEWDCVGETWMWEVSPVELGKLMRHIFQQREEAKKKLQPVLEARPDLAAAAEAYQEYIKRRG